MTKKESMIFQELRIRVMEDYINCSKEDDLISQFHCGRFKALEELKIAFDSLEKVNIEVGA